MDDDDDIPVAIISKPKLKSFGFANSLSSVFKFGTLKEINLNTKINLIEENLVQKSPTKEAGIKKINNEAALKIAEKVKSPIIEPKVTVTKVVEAKTSEKCYSSIKATTNIVESENKTIINENNKRPRDEEVDEERDLKRPNFSQVDYKDKKY